MLGFLKNIFNEDTTSTEHGNNFASDYKDDVKVQIATCALFLEIANSDDEFSPKEKEEIFQIMQDLFDLSEEHVRELVELSEEQMKRSISLYEFTDIINQRFTSEQKYNVLLNLWRLIFVDNKLHAYEDYFIRKISANLHLSHNDLIAAKMEAKSEMNQ